MNTFNFYFKTIIQSLFVIIFFSTPSAKSLDKFTKAEHVSNYFSGILLLNENQYEESFSFLKKLTDLRLSIQITQLNTYMP